MDELPLHSGIKRMGDWGGVVQYGPGDSSMIVMFYLKPVINPSQSDANNRPTYDDKIFVRIHPPGERLNIVDRPATDNDKKRFPVQWMQFRENAPQETSGTPIDMLFPSTPSVSAALKASGVHTVEQCAELSAHAIETIGMGAQQWVNTAHRYLQVANKGVKASELRKMTEDKDREIHSLKHTLDLMKKEIDHLREQVGGAVTMNDVQQLFANQGGGGKRGVFPPGNLPQSFDAQGAQIAATHITRDLAKKSPKTVEAPPRRTRARIAS
jgi:hypothetical protein